MIYLIVSVFFDMIFINIISLSFQNISYLFPLFFISSIPICFLIIKNKKVFFCAIGLFGILYDLLYSDVVLINFYYVILYGLFIYIYYFNRKVSFFNIVSISLFGFILYDFYICVVLIFINYSSFSIYDIFYKNLHSLIINLIYIILSIYIFRSRIFGYKKIYKQFVSIILFFR